MAHDTAVSMPVGWFAPQLGGLAVFFRIQPVEYAGILYGKYRAKYSIVVKPGLAPVIAILVATYLLEHRRPLIMPQSRIPMMATPNTTRYYPSALADRLAYEESLFPYRRQPSPQ